MNKILERYELQSKKPQPKYNNCIGAAFYLIGIDSEEKYRAPGEDIRNYGLELTDSINDAVLVGIGRKTEPGVVNHLMVIHPEQRDKILHRPSSHSDLVMGDLETELNNLFLITSLYHKAYYFKFDSSKINQLER